MKNKQAEPDYSDQYDSFPPDSCGTDEARAWMIYEYARESKTFLRLLEKHKRGMSSYLGDALGLIKDLSVPVYKIVKVMGRRPSFAKPWTKLSRKQKMKFIECLSVPAVSIAPEDVVRDCLVDDPVLGLGQDITSKLPFGTDQPLRFIPLLLNAELTKSELINAITDFFEKELKLEGRRGRGANSKNSFSTYLRDLAVLRLISKRSVSDARKISTSLPSPLFQKHGGERTRAAQIKRAQTTFRELFLGCTIDPDLKLEDEMVSYRLYKIHHSSGGKRQAGKKMLSQNAL
jgi:hypothetical protein